MAADVEAKLKYIEDMLEYCRVRARDPEQREKEWSWRLALHMKVHSYSASPVPTIRFEFAVRREHTNALGNMHGGCVATLFDFATSSALGLVSRPGFWQMLGVSRTLNTTYLRPIPAGETVLVECELASVGKRMAHTRAVLRRLDDPAHVFATCEHGKVNTDPDPAKSGKL